MVTVTATCDRYLWHMMRRIVGTLVEVGSGKLKPGDVVIDVQKLEPLAPASRRDLMRAARRAPQLDVS